MSHPLYSKQVYTRRTPGLWKFLLSVQLSVCMCICVPVYVCVSTPEAIKTYSCEMKIKEINSIVVQYMYLSEQYVNISFDTVTE